MLLKNTGIRVEPDRARLVGIFDTLGYEQYENTAGMVRRFSDFDPDKPLQYEGALDPKSPIYLVETPVRNEAMTIISSRLKKTRLRYRSFNPEEETRLAGLEGAQQVVRSFGVIVPLLSNRWRDYDVHNIRSAFVAGLAFGMRKVLLLLQEVDGPIPLDVVDICRSYRDPEDILDLFVISPSMLPRAFRRNTKFQIPLAPSQHQSRQSYGRK